MVREYQGAFNFMWATVLTLVESLVKRYVLGQLVLF